jgi:hypothetical protein
MAGKYGETAEKIKGHRGACGAGMPWIPQDVAAGGYCKDLAPKVKLSAKRCIN